MTRRSIKTPGISMACVMLAVCCIDVAHGSELRLLFMGDNGHHRPAARFGDLAAALRGRGIVLKYTDRMEDLNPTTLASFDGLLLYANIDRIEDVQAKAVLDFVAGGKGFIPLHCATYCWRNNRDIVALMGGQFQRHGARVFSTQIAEPKHPVMQGYGGFTSWDETYIHDLHHEENRPVLETELKANRPQATNGNHGPGSERTARPGVSRRRTTTTVPTRFLCLATDIAFAKGLADSCTGKPTRHH